MLKFMTGISGLALLASLCIGAGCCGKKKAPVPYAQARSTVLLGAEPTAPMATRIARSPWPATDGEYVGPQETYFVEYYRDNFGGNEFQERSNPQRQYRSYRVGMKQK